MSHSWGTADWRCTLIAPRGSAPSSNSLHFARVHALFLSSPHQEDVCTTGISSPAPSSRPRRPPFSWRLHRWQRTAAKPAWCELAWKKPRIARALAVNRSELGLSGSKVPAEVQTIAGQPCVFGPLFALDVADHYAFDIDEGVDVTLTYAPRSHAAVHRRVGSQWRRWVRPSNEMHTRARDDPPPDDHQAGAGAVRRSRAS